MTLSFATQEAQRRADVLGNSYIVVRRKGNTDPDGYMVMLYLPPNFETVDKVYPAQNDLRNMREVPTIFETDQEGTATGTVHTFCSEECRDASNLPLGEHTVYGASFHIDLCEGSVCETCGKAL